MAPSQLKQLKANLHTRRTSKNSKLNSAAGKENTKDGLSRAKTSTFDSSGQKSARRWQKPRSDPKARADAIRRKTLLPAIQNRHKVGGIVDRRIGENDPTMTPEERMLQRYAKQRSKRDTFNLEADEGDEEDDFLTHGGKSILDLPPDKMDDYNMSDQGEAGSDGDGEMMVKKRKRDLDDEGDQGRRDEHPERRKSKKEIMEEVIAKSKLHKHERQKAKDEDDDIREELDKGLGDLLAVLRGNPRPSSQPLAPSKPATMEIHPDRIARMNGTLPAKPIEVPAADLPPTPPEESLPAREPSPSPPPPPNYKQQVEKEYDQRLRQMAMDQRAQPTVRTKTAEEKIADEAAKLKELEAKRLRRMRGEQEDNESETEAQLASDSEAEEGEAGDVNEAEDFGFQNAPVKPKGHDVEDEDDFVIDDDLVATGSDIDSDFSEESDDTGAEVEEDDDDEFLKDVLPGGSKSGKADLESKTSKLPYTYPCPRSHEELLRVVHDIPINDLPLVIQRIRALYHPQLNSANKEKLSHFASSLIDHLYHLASQQVPLSVVEQLIRHIHSLSKTHLDTSSATFRKHLRRMHETNSMTVGDLLILTAVGTVYPTSDHFHQVVTPAITLMGRWLGMTSLRPENPGIDSHLRTGAYLVALSLKYQSYAKRYIPESLRFTTTALLTFPTHALTTTHTQNLMQMTRLWSNKTAFFEMLVPAAYKALKRTSNQQALAYLRIALRQSILTRRPLELHHHKPLAIPSRIPRFEDNFHPDRHYDPDAERAESARLRKEHKRERKGAVRELRKDAEFISREKYREKKERDEEYKKRQRRIVSEIQAEEGREGNLYEREKRRRKGAR